MTDWDGSAASQSVTRSIPACAGEPPRAVGRIGRHGVYPRVCGGTDNSVGCKATVEGLSPRVRGNQLDESSELPYKGSIPACAGEPSHLPRLSGYARVYPRVCGGTRCRASGRTAPAGLSPRVRGNHAFNVELKIAVGSIPACAGEPHD